MYNFETITLSYGSAWILVSTPSSSPYTIDRTDENEILGSPHIPASAVAFSDMGIGAHVTVGANPLIGLLL